MQFSSTLFFLAGLAGTASAAPTPNITEIAEQLLATRGSGAMCGYQFHATFPYVGIYMPNNLMGSSQGTGSWGGGLIDNLRGSETAPLDWCNPMGWQAVTDDAGTGLAAVFNVEVGCSGSDVAHALHAASGQWVICADDLGADLATIAQIGQSVASILAPFVKV